MLCMSQLTFFFLWRHLSDRYDSGFKKTIQNELEIEQPDAKKTPSRLSGAGGQVVPDGTNY